MLSIHPTYPSVCTDHQPVPICACGDNSRCPNCGQGQGSIPCRCAAHKGAWNVDLHQRLNLIARLCTISPELDREWANEALNDLFYGAKINKLVWLYNLPRRTITAIAGLRPNACAELLGDLLDEMGVPE